MSIREVPRSFVYGCDGCGKEHKQENAAGHYHDSRPPRWARLKLARSAYDYQGAVVGDGSTEYLLCDECSQAVEAEIDAVLERRREG